MTSIDLAIIDAFLNAPWGTPQMHAALADVISLADSRRRAHDSMAASREYDRKKREGLNA